jgi:hypothetical protein
MRRLPACAVVANVIPPHRPQLVAQREPRRHRHAVVHRREIDVSDFDSIDDSGIALRAGLRGRVFESFELSGGLKYADLNDFGSETTAQVGARFYFTKMFALGADIGCNDDGTSWMLGGRFDFHNQR